MVLHQCPYCHRPFEAELLSKEEIGSSEATRVGDTPLAMSAIRGITQSGVRPGVAGGRLGLILELEPSDRDAIALHPEAFITYKLGYRCKHCGTEWAKISVEEKPFPETMCLTKKKSRITTRPLRQKKRERKNPYEKNDDKNIIQLNDRLSLL